jgi:hypothetical protein
MNCDYLEVCNHQEAFIIANFNKQTMRSYTPIVFGFACYEIYPLGGTKYRAEKRCYAKTEDDAKQWVSNKRESKRINGSKIFGHLVKVI